MPMQCSEPKKPKVKAASRSIPHTCNKNSL
jgi:hypothetical protein